MAFPFITKAQVNKIIEEHGQGPGPGPTPTVGAMYQHSVTIYYPVHLEMEGMVIDFKMWAIIDFITTLSTKIESIESLLNFKDFIIEKGTFSLVMYNFPEGEPDTYIGSASGVITDISGTDLKNLDVVAYQCNGEFHFAELAQLILIDPTIEPTITDTVTEL